MYKKYDLCTIPKCGSPHEARGYCVKHYKRFIKTGDPITPSAKDKRHFIKKDNKLYIPLGLNARQGYAIVSLEDYWVSDYNWYKGKNGYSSSRIKGVHVYMHRMVMGNPTSGEVDHINRVKTDNRRENLRVVSRSENMLNVGLRSSNTSGYTGVSYLKNAKKYQAYVNSCGKTKYLGLFNSSEDAFQARQTALGR